ncbi:MAG: Cell division protein FtsA [Candidatus Falkowbacteria bacterium GW2011_GWC2_38_22]|uniref:Cell division protein FtsA n=1 Tax=Candidatus Falkowbacteria bacterium GW2011_GWE1_38_31 TaxID=1618638 RepID=A0A0G0JTA2_9BACT|nr:MAG: Cell division protein FtsA [Candidatus Falkowbacteria bacterium GW2011_GWF2_38_1205]KKQ62000.1 MAG: Cell division protein FtsA [Candidatus Falkowbacteria bacterium GW2011_GWC2_38_22]KKQ63838.1 MAG: Cell division protein FtsA [Candidatus Falkowbacteria bacterium GW2011_GWF1_38_22]KKQ66095.1 MAG: Cell division protein FtsA [Candidatus Falkowbacteria bacterium GW2011_GWE2_38_254]KKQ70698.1 MAG: Cell division protein FtsA [Candidatus Falkowbacteria bacterium GW2011_GWE1_38_31]KKQ73068.1 MA
MFVVKNSKYPIGLDISDTSLKAVQLDRTGDKISIQALSRIELSEGIIINGEIKNQELFKKNIDALLLKPKYGFFSTRNVVACLPETKTYIKLIEIDNTPNPIADIIENDMENHIPIPASELYYDWQIIDKNTEKISVLIGAAPKDIVSQYISALKFAKFSINALEIESAAIVRSLLQEESPKYGEKRENNYAIIDIGANRASMIIYAKNTIVLAISVPISGKDVTERIAKALEITNDQAEKAKIICGLDKNKAQGIVSDILAGNIKDLNSKIKNALNFFHNHYPALGDINKIILCGGGATIKNLSTLIKETHNIETELGNMSINIAGLGKILDKEFTEELSLSLGEADSKDSKTISIKQNTNLVYTTAFGLAMRNVYLDM